MKGVFHLKFFGKIFYLLNMKYIISESKLEKLIMNYLDSSIQQVEEVYHVEDGDEYVGWKIDDEVVFAIEKSSNKLGILDTFFSTLQGLFGLTQEQCEEYLLKWIKENLGIVPNAIGYQEW
jgi:hypothetical protein